MDERHWENIMNKECEIFLKANWPLDYLKKGLAQDHVAFVRNVINPECRATNHPHEFLGKIYDGVQLSPLKRNPDGTQYWVLNIEVNFINHKAGGEK